jgi:hypothetical protein
MNFIMLDPQQAAFLAQATERIEIRGPDGTVLGSFYPDSRAHAAAHPNNREIYPFTEVEIAEAKRRSLSDGPRYITQQVLDHLRSLES